MTPLTAGEISEAVLKLPSLPTIVLDLFNALDQEDVDVHTLSQKISHDQALTAKVLGLANSSFYGMQSKVGSIAHAVAVLGFNSVRSLVTAAAVVQAFAGSGSKEFNYALWKHAIATALAARALAKGIGENEELAFIAGLLHNVGRLVLATYSPARYQEVLSWSKLHDVELSAAETQVLGIDHMTAGRAALTRWKFPTPIIEALPASGMPPGESLPKSASIITVADAIAYALDLGGTAGSQVPVISPYAWDQLQLSEPILLEVFSATEKQFEDVCVILQAAGN